MDRDACVSISQHRPLYQFSTRANVSIALHSDRRRYGVASEGRSVAPR